MEESWQRVGTTIRRLCKLYNEGKDIPNLGAYLQSLDYEVHEILSGSHEERPSPDRPEAAADISPAAAAAAKSHDDDENDEAAIGKHLRDAVQIASIEERIRAAYENQLGVVRSPSSLPPHCPAVHRLAAPH